MHFELIKSLGRMYHQKLERTSVLSTVRLDIVNIKINWIVPVTHAT